MSDFLRARREINYLLDRLEQSVAHAEVQPFRSDNEIITRLYEKVEKLITREKIDNLYERHLSDDDSIEVLGIAFLADAYAMKDYTPLAIEGLRKRRRAIDAARETMDSQETECQGNASNGKTPLDVFRDATARAKEDWGASEAAKLSFDPRWISAGAVWRQRGPRQAIVEAVRFLLDVELGPDEDDPWVMITNCDHFSRSKSMLSRYASNGAKPEFRRAPGTKRGKYEVRRSRLAEYIKPQHLNKYGVQ